MSRPPKITRLKPEENQPPLEAYVSDLFSLLTISTTENKTKQTVTPVNVGKPVSANGVGARTAGKVTTTANGQRQKDDTKQRHRRRSTGEPGDVSVAKKQIKHAIMTSVTKSKQTSNLVKTPLSGVKNLPPTTQECSNPNLKPKNVEPLETLSGVTSSVTPANQTAAKAKLTSMSCSDLESTNRESLAVVTEHQESHTTRELTTSMTKLTGVTGSVVGVTTNPDPVNPTNMTSNAGTTNKREHSTSLAIARLETKLVESRKNDIIEMEKRLTTNMKVIVDNSIQEALKNITSFITKVVSEDPEIL